MIKNLTKIAVALSISFSAIAQDKAVDDASGAIAFIQTIADETVAA